MELTVVELFAGVGGFRVGLNDIKEFDKETGVAIENKDWKFVWANQWEPSTKIQPAFECYQKRFANDKSKQHSNQDINKVDKNNIPNHSLLVGGFPCQDYSVARTISNEMGIEGKKGVLWWDIVDTIDAKRPPFILLENVDRLLKSPANKRGRDFAIMLRTLDELGYIVQWRMINAGDYGMPQRRRRVFIFASSKDSKYSESIIEKNKEDYLINDGFFNDTFPIKNPKKIEYKSLNEYEDVVDISDNFNEGKFLTTGIFVEGEVINFDIEPIVEEYYTLGDVIKEVSKYQGLDLEDYIIPDDSLEKWEYLKGGKKIPRKRADGTEYFYTEGNMSCPDALDLPARTMLTSESTVNRSSHIVEDIKTKKLRTITEIEAEALQMFPYDWTNTGMSKRQRYFMMGNALVTGIVSRLEPKLRNIIESE